jgi:hypothetical protein
MNIKILAQNIVNNPSDFTAEQIEKYFEDYAELRLSDVSNRRELLIAFANYCEREWNCTEVPTDVIDEYLESN